MDVDLIKFGLGAYAHPSIDPRREVVTHVEHMRGRPSHQTALHWTDVANGALAYIASLEKVAHAFAELPEGRFYWQLTKEIGSLRREIQDLKGRNAWQAKNIRDLEEKLAKAKKKGATC